MRAVREEAIAWGEKEEQEEDGMKIRFRIRNPKCVDPRGQ